MNIEEYYPFGETSFGAYSKKRYRFCGKEKDEESGMYYYGARYYFPWLCRFVSVDPLAGDYAHLSPYNYASNNPITHIDVDGMQNPAEGKTPQSGEASSGGEGKVISESKKIDCHHAQQTKDLLETKETSSDNIKSKGPVKLSDKEVEAIKEFVNKLNNPSMSLSKEGLEFLKTSEGGFKAQVYDANTGKKAEFDNKGNIIGKGDWTIGYGHKLTTAEIKDKTFTKEGITEKNAEKLLLKDVQTAVDRINKRTDVSLTQSQFDSLVSFAYQQGIYNKSLDKVMALVNAGKLNEATEQIKNTGNKVHRREAESVMFSKGIYLPPQFYENPSYYKAKFKSDYNRLSQ